MSNIVLKCENLNKSFGKKKILTDVSFEISKGDILGFIGPNGSGKTTTIKLILGLNSINSGKVTINGFDIEKDFERAIQKVGAIVENPDMYMYLSGYENLKLIAKLYKGISKERIDEVVKLVKLEGRIKDKVSKYSLGMRQRLGIAQALLNHPNLLILDEPTNGLDPEGIKELRDLLKSLAKKENIAVLISSHNLAELENFCNKVCIIQNGKVIETNEVKKLKKEIVESSYIFEVEDTSNINNIIKNANVIDDSHFIVNIQREEIPEVVANLVNKKIPIYEVKENIVSLEEAFLNKTGGNKID
ncbi:MAG: ABC transporter ATP-binding protein [Bacilli bacterium]